MCGIAGLIHRKGTSNVGQEMTSMLQALKHRGPDSTGFAIYGEPKENTFVLRFKVAEQEDLHGALKDLMLASSKPIGEVITPKRRRLDTAK